MSLEARLLLNFVGFFKSLFPFKQPKQRGSSCSQIGKQRREVLCWKEPSADRAIDKPEPLASQQVPTARETCSSAGSRSPSSRCMEASPPSQAAGGPTGGPLQGQRGGGDRAVSSHLLAGSKLEPGLAGLLQWPHPPCPSSLVFLPIECLQHNLRLKYRYTLYAFQKL